MHDNVIYGRCTLADLMSHPIPVGVSVEGESTYGEGEDSETRSWLRPDGSARTLAHMDGSPDFCTVVFLNKEGLNPFFQGCARRFDGKPRLGPMLGVDKQDWVNFCEAFGFEVFTHAEMESIKSTEAGW